MSTYAAPFTRVTYGGKPMDAKTQAFIQAMEAKLGYPLTIVQGCYNPGGVSQSAGTHDKGGVVDLSPWDAERKVQVARSLGGFAWHRPYIAGLWGEHVHLGIRDHGNLAPAAAQQQHYFDLRPRRNGLAGEPVDPDQYPPTWPAPTFIYPPKQEVKPMAATKVQQARDEVSRAIHALSQARALLDDSDPSRVVAHAQIDNLHAAEKECRAVMQALPKK